MLPDVDMAYSAFCSQVRASYFTAPQICVVLTTLLKHSELHVNVTRTGESIKTKNQIHINV